MTALWIVIGAVALLAAAWLARPFLSRAQVEMNESESAISIYRDQLDELRRDAEAGLISVEEHAAAEQEIEARTIAAAKRLDAGVSVSRQAPMLAGSVAVGCAVAAVALYAALGTPRAPDQPLAERRTEHLTQRAEAGDLNSRISLLIDKTKENPESFEDWWMLGRGYAATGDHASAADAYRRAAELSGDRPSVLSAYAEALTLANGNKVPQAARLIFQQILQKTPDPRARYYAALAKAQAQDFEAALEDWTALARESDPGAPWMPLVRRDIANMARFLKRDVTEYLADATPGEIAKAGGEAPDADASETRIAALTDALSADPMDHSGWIELAHLNAALGRDAAAAGALAKGREHFAAAPFVLGKLDEAARDLGLDMLDAADAPRGPDAADIAAAGSMTEADRDAMIAGMVAGLAARLEEAPQDPEGWVMLIRSYSVLGKTTKARDAYDRAVAVFDGDEAALMRLREAAETAIRRQ